MSYSFSKLGSSRRDHPLHPAHPTQAPPSCTRSNHQVKIGSSPCFSNGICSIGAAASISRGPLSRSPVAHHPRREGLGLFSTLFSFYYCTTSDVFNRREGAPLVCILVPDRAESRQLLWYPGPLGDASMENSWSGVLLTALVPASGSGVPMLDEVKSPSYNTMWIVAFQWPWMGSLVDALLTACERGCGSSQSLFDGFPTRLGVREDGLPVRRLHKQALRPRGS